MPRIIISISILLALASHCAVADGVIAQAKLLQNSQTVTLSGVTVTLVFAGYFYVQDPDRAGLRVQSSQSVSPGTKYDVSGTMDTQPEGERYVRNPSVTVPRSDTAKSVMMKCSSLGGSDYACVAGTSAGQRGVSGGVGPNNIGSYVKLCGKIVGGGVINDGSGDVRLLLPIGVASPAIGSVISVDGIAVPWIAGTSTYRALRVANASSLHTQKPSDATTPYAGEMIYIPAGSFLMGAGSGASEILPSELPQHNVYLDGYWIAKCEMTRGEYGKFIAAGGYNNPAYWSTDGWYYRNLYNLSKPGWWDDSWLWGHVQFQTDNHPVVGVSWYEAEAYCNWAGLRLPTEAEWEKAADWNPSTNKATTFPWGDIWDATKSNNAYDTLYTSPYTAPVGSYPTGASYYGCRDMAGNVWEWVHDWMGPTYYQSTPPGGWANPTGPESNPMKTKVLKGGSWWADYPGPYRLSGTRSSVRMESFARWNEYPNQWGGRQGFRIAQ